jgi:hypothetical protein
MEMVVARGRRELWRCVSVIGWRIAAVGAPPTRLEPERMLGALPGGGHDGDGCSAWAAGASVAIKSKLASRSRGIEE